jgi:hypothetical protein
MKERRKRTGRRRELEGGGRGRELKRTSWFEIHLHSS